MKKIAYIFVLLFITINISAQNTAQLAQKSIIGTRTREKPLINKKNINIYDPNVISHALAVPYVDANVKVYDFAGLFTDNECAKLKSQCLNLESKYGVDAVVVTIDKNPLPTTDDYCCDFYDYNDFGVGSRNSGICIVIDMQNRNYRYYDMGLPAKFQVAGSNDYSYQSIMGSALRNGKYYSGVSELLGRYGEDYRNVILSTLGIIAGIAFVISTIVVLIARSSHSMVHKATSAGFYAVKNTFFLSKSQDVYLRSSVSKIYSPREQRSSSGGSSGGGFSSSSGISHSGGGGSF